jgi:hypothetical protein
VHEKIGLLLKQHLALQKENERLRDDLKKMLKRCEDLSREAEKSRQQAEVSMLSGRGLDDSDKKMLEKRLNLYVREIDKCIALLQE